MRGEVQDANRGERRSCCISRADGEASRRASQREPAAASCGEQLSRGASLADCEQLSCGASRADGEVRRRATRREAAVVG